MRPAAASTDRDVRLVVGARAVRGLADGFVSVLLARYLTEIGFSPVQVGAIVTGTLLGSAVLTLAFGFTTHRFALRTLLVTAAAVMTATGAGFATVTQFWPLLLVAVVGTLNPSSGDMSAFLPTEQALVAGRVDAAGRPRVFARYNLAAIVAAAVGALASGLPETLARDNGWDVATTQRLSFWLYALAGIVVLLVYRRLRRDDPVRTDGAAAPKRRALHTSRRIVLELAGLFSLDSAGSGFITTSLLVLWLDLRFGLSAGTTAWVFFAAGLLGAASQLLAPRLASRIGLVRTMAFTHIPANVALVAAAFAPTGEIAIALLLVRAALAQMDVPARQAFVMAVVPAEERAAASSVTNVPRSLAAAATPFLAGVLLAHSTFGWPLVIAGVVKGAYDVVLLVLYRNVAEEVGATRRS